MAHTGFPIRVPEGSLKKSSLLPQSFKGETAGLQSQTLWLRRHWKGLCSKFRDINKTNGRRRSDDLLLQSAPTIPTQIWIPQRQWKGTSATTVMLAPRRHSHRGSSQKPPFRRVIAGQSTASVVKVTGRNTTLRLSESN